MFKKLLYRIEVLARWVSIWLTRALHFLHIDLWLLNAENFGKWKKRLIHDTRTIFLTVHTFSKQKMAYQAVALAFKSMLAIIPAIAICFYLTDWIGLRDKFAQMLQENLGEEKLIQALMNAADKIVDTAESGLFGFISMVSFIWIVLSLMITVRQVFNNAWCVSEKRILQMIGGIFGVIFFSPFVVMIFFSGSVLYSNVLDLVIPGDFFLSRELRTVLTWALFAATSIFALSAMYKFIPGTRVHYKHALKAAIVAGIAFTAVQFLYLETQIMVSKQNAIYGVLAAIPLFMVWLNLGWSIILYGAELSYAFQNVNVKMESVRKSKISSE